MSPKSKNFLFILTGSISIYKCMAALSSLMQKGHSIEVVMTESALKFIGLPLVEGLIGKKVHTNLWESGRAMEHIHLARNADHICVCPATANFINQMASGQGVDLATNLFLAHDFQKPWTVFPAMNSRMWDHPATRESVRKLKSWGVQIVEPRVGILACGEQGAGRLLEPEEIVSILVEETNPKIHTETKVADTISKKKVLITSGGTSESIDSVRKITNVSSGQTGALLAETYLQRNWDVYFLSAQGSRQPRGNGLNSFEFQSFLQLKYNLQHLLQVHHFDLVIHLAAVSDYGVEKVLDQEGRELVDPTSEKISSSYDSLTLCLKRNEKLVSFIKQWSLNKTVSLVAFKLTDKSLPKLAVEKLFKESSCDWVVQNDVNEFAESKVAVSLAHSNAAGGISNTYHPFRVFKRDQSEPSKPWAEFFSKAGLAADLPNVIEGEL